MGNKQSAPSYNNQQNDEQFVLEVTDKDINEAKIYYGKPNESLIKVNDVYKDKFKELNKQLTPLIGEDKPTNFIVKIYKKVKDKIKDTLVYNKNKASTVREANFDVLNIGIKSAAEITNEHVTITLGIITTTTLAIAPPIGLLIAASSILILKTLHTIRSNHELFDIMNDLLSLLTVITEEFKIIDDSDVPHLVILKTHIVKIFSLMSSINGIYNWRKMVIFPNSVINSFVKEISLINTALIVDLKIDLTNLTKNQDKKTNKNDDNIETILAKSIEPSIYEMGVADDKGNKNVENELHKEESEQVKNILSNVVNKNITINDPGLNKNITELVNTTNLAATDQQLRNEYITYLKQVQIQEGGTRLKKRKHTRLKKTNKPKKYKNKTSKCKTKKHM